MTSITSFNVPDAYRNLIWYFKEAAQEEDSRNGPVLTLPNPFTLTIRTPRERVLTDPIRNANPFFHALEFVWMTAGRRDAAFPGSLVKRMWEYAEDDGNFHAAYGYRWSNHFDSNQIPAIIDLLKTDPTTRRAVLTMWDPNEDLLAGQYRDHPCNTHAYFRITRDALDMTVCNRSNDIVWGMLGANAVHMTLLHELIAASVGVRMGRYHVMTNNAHIYKSVPRFDEIIRGPHKYDVYDEGANPITLLSFSDTYDKFRQGCIDFCKNPAASTGVYWLDHVAAPLYHAYMDKEKTLEWVDQIDADDWRIAAFQWVDRNRGEG